MGETKTTPMKKAYALILGLFLILSATWANSEYRTFTSLDGREMVAAIQRVSANEVTIKRKADGRNFTVTVDTFSKADQNFIKSWDEMNRLSHHDALDVKIRRVNGDRSKSSSLSTSTKSWMEGYEISVTNETRGDVTGLEVKYIIFMFDEAVAATQKDQGKLQRDNSNFNLASLAPDQKFTHQTKKFKMSSSKLKEGWYYTNGGSKQSKDELAGCWVRVYKGGRIISQTALPSSVMRTEPWEVNK